MMGTDPATVSHFGRSFGQIHKVAITRAFFIQTTEVTQGQWFQVMETRPWELGSLPEGDDYPVTCVKWIDVQDFIQKLNNKEGVNVYRLPTEAEWEYACRAGSNTAYCFGDNITLLDDYAWHHPGIINGTPDFLHRVASKKPNLWGLYDMHGNAGEWCSDWFGEYKSSPQTNPKGPSPHTEWTGKVFRGDYEKGWPERCRSDYRDYSIPIGGLTHLGFRLVMQ